MKTADWNCTACTALNDPTAPKCWNCETSLLDQKRSTTEANQQSLEKALEVQEEIDQRLAALARATSLGQATIADLIRGCIGERIGINVVDPAEAETAMVISVQQEFFTVEIKDFLYHVPFSSVLRIVAAANGSALKGALNHYPHRLVVKVFDLVIYKGSVGVGFGVSFPI